MANEKLIDANKYPCRSCGKTYCHQNCKEFIDWLENTVDAVVLPCKIGDKVYRIDKGNYHSNWKPFVEELTVTEIRQRISHILTM